MKQIVKKELKDRNVKKELVILAIFAIISCIPVLLEMSLNNLDFVSLYILLWFLSPYIILLPILLFTSHTKVISRIIAPITAFIQLYINIQSFYLDSNSAMLPLAALITPILLDSISIILLIIFGVVELVSRNKKK